MIETLKDLSEADREQRKRDYPSVPDHVIVKTRFGDKTANELTKSIKKWFQLMGGQCERVSVTGRAIDNTKIVTDVIGRQRMIGSVQYIKSSMKVGTADLSGILWSIAFRIEVKVGKDTWKDAQKEYAKDVERAGGVYILAHTWDNFIEQILKHRKTS